MDEVSPTLIEGRDAFAQSALQIVALPRLQLRILSQELERAIYGAPAFIDALKAQLLEHRGLRVQILLADRRAAFLHSAPLRQLASRLSSQFQFRTPPEIGGARFTDEALIADRAAYLHRSDDRSRVAKLAVSDAAGAHRLIADFDALWADAEVAADFRDLPM